MVNYAIANGVRGFGPVTSLRVSVLRREAGMVWVRTADIADAGTPLVLDESQIESIEAETVSRHKAGLVWMA
jgi:hypothetical protein